jgi:hypothetical protein
VTPVSNWDVYIEDEMEFRRQFDGFLESFLKANTEASKNFALEKRSDVFKRDFTQHVDAGAFKWEAPQVI